MTFRPLFWIRKITTPAGMGAWSSGYQVGILGLALGGRVMLISTDTSHRLEIGIHLFRTEFAVVFAQYYGD